MSPMLTLALLVAGWTPPPAAPPATAEPARETSAQALEIESPGSRGARYGIGVDLSLESIDDLDLVRGQRTFSFVSREGGSEGFRVDVDDEPGWEQTTLGLQVPVALPSLALGGGGRVDWSLVLEGAGVEGSLELDEPRNADDNLDGPRSTTLEGRGSRFGIGLQATATLCRACRWTWSGGYRYRTVRGLDLEEEGVAEASFAPLTDEDGELQRDDHELTARLGYALAGGRLTPWLGIRGQWTEATVEHVQTFRLDRSEFTEERTLSLETESERVAALVGVDFRLARSVVGRIEGTFGDGESLLLKVVTFPGGRTPRSPADPPLDAPPLTGPASPTVETPPPIVETPQEIADQRRRADELAEDAAPRVDALRQRFRQRAEEIERNARPGRPLDPSAVRALLDDVEEELRDILAPAELQPILAWFVDFAERSRPLLGAQTPPVADRRRPDRPPGAGGYRLAAYSPAPQPPGDSARPDPSRGVLSEIGAFLDKLFELTDERRLTQPLCVRSQPAAGALIGLFAALPGSRVIEQTTEGKLNVVYRGLYAYRATLGGDRRIACPADSDPADCAFLDLWTSDDAFLVCDFSRGVERCLQQAGDPATCGR